MQAGKTKGQDEHGDVWSRIDPDRLQSATITGKCCFGTVGKHRQYWVGKLICCLYMRLNWNLWPFKFLLLLAIAHN